MIFSSYTHKLICSGNCVKCQNDHNSREEAICTCDKWFPLQTPIHSTHTQYGVHTHKTHKFHPQAAQTLFYKVLGRYIYI
jgi:hypothetical protein